MMTLHLMGDNTKHFFNKPIGEIDKAEYRHF